MKNATNPDIEALFKWWNGRVFSFDTTKQVKADDVESGMEEAELVLGMGREFSDFEIAPPSAQHGHNWGAGNSQVNNYEEEFIGAFDNLTLAIQGGPNQPASSSRTMSLPPPHALLPHTAVTVDLSHESNSMSIVQPEEVVAQNPASLSAQKAEGRKTNRKGKQRAVVNSEAAGRLEDGTGRNLRSVRRK